MASRGSMRAPLGSRGGEPPTSGFPATDAPPPAGAPVPGIAARSVPGDLLPSSPATSGRMSRQRRRDTVPELLLRRELHHRGLRFRVDLPVPGMPRRRADVVFTRARIAVFVDGCFWHGCPDHATHPASNAAWWSAKLARNIERDRETDDHLRNNGWSVLRFWEHADMTTAARTVYDEWARTNRSRTSAAELKRAPTAADADRPSAEGRPRPAVSAQPTGCRTAT